jgi:nucleotide-binding universal stress UspA family protein
METIIVPTDFSAAANNAAEYALQLANFLKGRVILVNAYHPFLPANYQDGFSPDIIESQKSSVLEKLKNLRKELLSKHIRNFDIECVAEMGFSYDVINLIAKRESADLIVMGITGEAGKIKKHMIGSTTLDVARNQEVPVFIIPENVKYERIKKISFACDLEKTEQTNLIYIAKSFCKIFEAELEIVNVDKPKNELSLEKAVTNYFVEQNLQNIKHQTVHIGGNNVKHELEDYFETHQTDLIMLNPKKHNLFYSMFNYSITKELAFHSKLPLLTIH